jgi:hypothetical protein
MGLAFNNSGKGYLRMFHEQQIYYENLANTAVSNFGKRHIQAHYVSNKEALIPRILELVPEGAVVGTAESMTLGQIGVYSALRQRGKNEVLYPFQRNEDGYLAMSGDESLEMMRRVLTCDVFISGANAVTLDGKLVNLDGLGNRVAPMIFGPKKVIVVVGVNKLVKDQDAALKRIKEICAPMNSLRHGLQHHDTEFLELPCVKTGVCVDCRRTQRTCNFISVIEGESHWNSGRMNIFIVGEQLGI